MRISDHIIIGEEISQKAAGILSAIKKDKQPSYKVWYAVTSALESENLMYIISSREYRLPFYRDESLCLLGLAGSRSEAEDIVLKIVKKGYDKEAILQMKQFIEHY